MSEALGVKPGKGIGQQSNSQAVQSNAQTATIRVTKHDPDHGYVATLRSLQAISPTLPPLLTSSLTHAR